MGRKLYTDKADPGCHIMTAERGCSVSFQLEAAILPG